MELTISGTTYTVLSTRRIGQNENFELAGPRGARYGLVEKANGWRHLFAYNGRTIAKWHEPSAEQCGEFVAPHIVELRDPQWGMDATRQHILTHTAELAAAVDALTNSSVATYALAGNILTISRAMSADAAQLARLEEFERLFPHWREL